MVTIVEYTRDHAQAVADMWNESRGNFGGGHEFETARDRAVKEQTSGNLVTMLAMEDKKVVGYCGLATYKQDTGALYIPLLNVHPEYIGKGIGKRLVLEAVQRTVEAGWPRVDLYTWPGNTQAVPLYKRCGFFWEDREDRTHLMNFIPLLLRHGILSTYVTNENWYHTLKREVKLEPDGETQSGFTTFTYHFETDKGNVSATVEHSSRTLCALETEQFKLEWTLPAHVLFVAKEYEATLRVINKTNKPLHIKGEALPPSSLHTTTTIEHNVEGEAEITIPFSVNEENGGHQSRWKTHPSFDLQLTVDGKPCALGCGYTIKKPVAVKPLIVKPRQLVDERGGEVFFEVKNELKEEITLTLSISSARLFRPETKSVTCSLATGEKQTLPLPVKEVVAGIEQLALELDIAGDGERFLYSDPHMLVVPDEHLITSYEREGSLYLINGWETLVFDKETGFARQMNAQTEEAKPWFHAYPVFGEPLNHELASKGWSGYSFRKTCTGIELTLDYEIQDGAGSLSVIYDWNRNKTLCCSAKIKNLSTDMLDVGYVTLGMRLDVDQLLMPAFSKHLYAGGIEEVELDDLPLADMNDTWMYFSWEKHSLAVSTTKSLKWLLVEHALAFQQAIPSLKPNDSFETCPISLQSDVFQTADAFTEHMGSFREKRAFTEVVHEQHGFFAHGEEGSWRLDVGKKQADTAQVHLDIDGEKRSIRSFDIHGPDSILLTDMYPPKGKTSALTIKYEGATFQKNYSLQAIAHGNETVRCQTNEEEGLEVHEVSNGILTFKAANEFSPAIYSLKTREREWLDHAFPKAGPKSWWNPWGGGIMTIPGGLNLLSVQKQKRRTEFVTMNDQWQQTWTGLKLTIKLEHSDWEGAVLEQFFVTLPKSSVLLHTTVFKQTGVLLHEQNLLTGAFFNKQEALRVYATENDEQFFTPSAGHFSLAGRELAEVVRLQEERSGESLVVVPQTAAKKREFYENKEVFTYMNQERLEKRPDVPSIQTGTQAFVWTDQLPSSEGWTWTQNVDLKEGDIF
ncbi:GNAT family N-acetyltransferase [Shouchella shacheensis]|uniref:GNAT family N-acetyltransferase n=1 Tax=Shouchella shacheensis TaxID=1649580 RepID=UPI00073FFC24|nr:GNAT family N-acetyltransferase [Shouchella shacheensis]